MKKIKILNDSDIFIDKIYSLNLLNNTYNEEITLYLMIQICNLFFQGSYDLLLLEILKKNIRNLSIFELLFSFLSDNEKKELFEKNKALIIKSIYIYSQINEYIIINKLLKYLENYFGFKFVQNLIFPPNDENEFNEMYNYIKSENICEEIEINDDYDDDNTKKKNLQQKAFLMNYCIQNNFVKNFETQAVMFQYYNVSLPNIVDYFPEISIECDKITKLKALNNINGFFIFEKNKKLIQSLNQFYYNIYELIEFIHIKSKSFVNELTDKEKIIFYDYFSLFINKKLPIKIKKLLDKILNNKNKGQITYIINRPNSLLSEFELFIILSLFEIKGESVTLIKGINPQKFFSLLF